MSFSIELTILLNDAKRLLARREPNNAHLARAIEATNAALIDTDYYLKHQHGNYTANPALAHKWNEASAAVRLVDSDIANIFYYKSRFWMDPMNFGPDQGFPVADLSEVRQKIDELIGRSRR